MIRWVYSAANIALPLRRTPLTWRIRAAFINIAIRRAATSGFKPSGRMLETQFLSASVLPTRGDYVR